MPVIITITINCLFSLIGYLYSLSQYEHFLPQIIALLSVIIIFYSLRRHTISLPLLNLIITTLVFTTGGLSSPVFFLIYFILFLFAFAYKPISTFFYSFFLFILLSSTTQSINSIFTFLSLILITPLVYFISKQYLEKQKNDFCLSHDETAFLFWLKLKFKTGIIKIIDSASILQSQPQLTPSQKNEIKFIKESAKNLLNSSEKLSNEIEHSDDEI